MVTLISRSKGIASGTWSLYAETRASTLSKRVRPWKGAEKQPWVKYHAPWK